MGVRFALVSVAKRAVKLALLPAAYLRREREPGLFVLIYHRVGARMGEEMDLPEARFTKQMRLLRERYTVVPLRAGLERVEASAVDRDLVAVTFDDGYQDVFARAWPVLSAFEIPATLFLATGFLDGTTPAPLSHPRGRGEPPRPLAWDAIHQMQQTGLVEVGSHSVTHPDFDRIDGARAERELAESKRVIAERLGTEPVVFAYPRAVVGHQDLVTRHYRWAVGGDRGKNVPGGVDRGRVQRTPVRRSDGTFFLRRRLDGIAPLEDRLYARMKWTR